MGNHTPTHCHCGAHRQGSDHCPECGCEEYESICDHVHEARSLLFRRGNLFTGNPYGVRVREWTGSYDLHGPFSSENEAWNFGMRLANESNGTMSFDLVEIEVTGVRSIATATEIREHRRRETEATQNMIADMERDGLL